MNNFIYLKTHKSNQYLYVIARSNNKIIFSLSTRDVNIKDMPYILLKILKEYGITKIKVDSLDLKYINAISNYIIK